MEPQTTAEPLDLELPNRLRSAIARSARLPPFITVEDAVTAVMCTLTEHLTAGGTRRVLDRVPPAVRPVFETCVRHREREGAPGPKLDRADVLATVADHLGVTPAHAELVCSAVFTALRPELPSSAVDALADQLPRSLRQLWLAPPIAAPDLDVAVEPEVVRRIVEKDLERRAHLPLHIDPMDAFTAVMCGFERRLSGGETRHLLLGLPAPWRALIERCAVHRVERAEVFGRSELAYDVADHLDVDEDTALRIIREVLRAAKRMLPQETIAEIDAQLPRDLRDLWRSALPTHPATPAQSKRAQSRPSLRVAPSPHIPPARFVARVAARTALSALAAFAVVRAVRWIAAR